MKTSGSDTLNDSSLQTLSALPVTHCLTDRPAISSVRDRALIRVHSITTFRPSLSGLPRPPARRRWLPHSVSGRSEVMSLATLRKQNEAAITTLLTVKLFKNCREGGIDESNILHKYSICRVVFNFILFFSQTQQRSIKNRQQ